MKNWIILGASLAALAVVLGAFGAHGLKNKVSPENMLIFETGIRYHMYHALGLIFLGILGFHYSANVIQLPAVLLSVGILIFPVVFIFSSSQDCDGWVPLRLSAVLH